MRSIMCDSLISCLFTVNTKFVIPQNLLDLMHFPKQIQRETFDCAELMIWLLNTVQGFARQEHLYCMTVQMQMFF